MYKIKSNYIYFISKELNKTYFLDCETKEMFEIDSVGTELIEELITTDDEKRSQEIVELFEGVDLFEKRSS